MIDIDKYKGQTEGLWFDGEATEISNAIYHGLIQLHPNELGKANARLAVDAPLLLAEVKRLREGIKKIARDYDFIAIKSQSRTKPRLAYNVPAGDGIHTVTFHQKACLKIMELIE